MIIETKVSNFKGIKQCKVQDLSRVNLFIGKNDSGKSSLLEALFHTCKEFVSGNLDGILRRRTNVFTGGRELWYRYDTKPEINVSLSFKNNVNIKLTIKMQQHQINTTLEAFCLTPTGHVEWKQQGKGSTYSTETFRLIVRSGLKALRTPHEAIAMPKVNELIEYIGQVIFIDCRSKANLSNLESKLGKIKLEEKDREFGGILDNIYGAGKEWEFLPHPDNPNEKRIAVKEDGKRMFLGNFGDGFRYGLAMCATAMTIEGTGIFIEEIESHQHFGSLKHLTRNLVDISRKNNLQLFITTHSNDVWNSFVRGVYLDDAHKEKEEFRCFLVERDITSGTVTAKSTEDIQRITEALGQI